MGDLLLELEHILRSQRITVEEEAVLSGVRSEVRNNFLLGTFAGGGVTWAVTSRLFKPVRVYLSGVIAMGCGFWMFNKTVDSNLERILCKNGSRMQKELGNMLQRKPNHDYWTSQLMHKHFFSERVFNDSNMENPTIRWRYRNMFNDFVVPENNILKETSSSKKPTNFVLERVTFPSNPTHVIYDSKNIEDPIGSVLGFREESERSDLSRSPTAPSDQTRHHKRSHRRRRRREDMKNVIRQEDL